MRDFWKSFSTTERRLLAVSALFFFVLLGLFFGVRTVDQSEQIAKTPKVGRIRDLKNEVRRRPMNDLAWSEASEDGVIRLGDAIFTGASSGLSMEFARGGSLNIGEKSMVVFRNIDDVDLSEGNFTLNVTGVMKFTVGGKPVVIEGNGSQVQIVGNKNGPPRFRLLKGKATVKTEDDTVRLKKNVTETVAAAVPDRPRPVDGAEAIRHVWTIEDLYTREGQLLSEKPEPPKRVAVDMAVRWTGVDKKTPVRFQMASGPGSEFSVPVSVSGDSLRLLEAGLGENRWRVSADGKNWSRESSFQVTGAFLSERPVLLETNSVVPIIGERGTSTVRLQSGLKTSGTVVQSSTTPDFSSGTTRTFWAEAGEIALSFYRPGTFYYRFRVADERSRLSEWSESQRFVALVPPTLEAPRFERDRLEVETGLALPLAWRGPADAQAYDVEIFDSKNQLVETRRTTEPGLIWTSKTPAWYRARVFAVDRWERRGEPSKPQVLAFKAPPPPVVKTPPVAAKQPPVRDPAQASSSLKIELPRSSFWNDAYRESLLSVEGSAATMQSKEQFFQEVAAPAAASLAVRGKHWWGAMGVEGFLKAKAFGLNASGSAISPLQAEARAHYRFSPWVPSFLLREMQVSLLVGYEMYRNSNDAIFSPSYDLIKFGTSIEFPVAKRWDSGGEILYGMAADASRKYEVSGRFGYYLRKDLSLGAGYRIHLFDAGSGKSSPNGGVPYREGYGEAYSTLRYHY